MSLVSHELPGTNLDISLVFCQTIFSHELPGTNLDISLCVLPNNIFVRAS
jgi:hypothetical protein